MRKIKILVACPEPKDSTSFYRAVGPMAVLAKQYENIEIIMGGRDVSDYSWATLRQIDLLFFQRPSIPTHQKIIEFALLNKVPVWIDYDDDLLTVPKDNPTFVIYNDPQVKITVQNSLRLATHTTVSTEHLKNQFSSYTTRMSVIPNALDTELFQRRTLIPLEQRQKRIVWRGSNTHMGDLLQYQQEILELNEEFPDWQWFFLGFDPWFITQRMKEASFGTAPFASNIEFFNLLQNIQAPIHMVPLLDNPFNRSKSNIAWIEGALAGSQIVAPDWQEWQQPGALLYTDRASFKARLKEAITNPDNERSNQSWAQVEKEFTLTHVNQKRKELIDSLLRDKDSRTWVYMRQDRPRPPEAML